MTTPAGAFAREFIGALAELGVRDYVLCPGSRSGPLAHSLAEADSQDRPAGAPEVSLHVRIDERSAAFVALGIARSYLAAGDVRPVAVVTTSGTAVGNLLPAVMEAHHAGLPLLLLTADRPSELKGVGANQTTDQGEIFGPFVRWMSESAAPLDVEKGGRATRLAVRAVATALGQAQTDGVMNAVGPVHLNIEFRAPLQADHGEWPYVELPATDKTRWRPRSFKDAIRGREVHLPARQRGIVIAGDSAGDIAREVAELHRWPLLAEPTSGAHTGDACIAGYVDFLASPRGAKLAAHATVIVVIGRPTLSRHIQKLIGTAGELYIAAHGARWKEAPRSATNVYQSVPDTWLEREPGAPDTNDEWLNYWREAVVPVAVGWNADAVAAEVLAALGAGDTCVVGSSGPVRALDRLAPAWPVGEAPTIIANRGLAGIDGTISTAVGVALGSKRPVTALMGDVTFAHDVGGLLVGPRERRPQLRIVMVNDGGGTIFATLEHKDGDPVHVERVFTTPHGVDFAAVCAGYAVAHTAVADVEALRKALARPIDGFEVIEAKV
jgi:2-succinyl-5-enolpyruvyl-6-hydroxy-3-cyclohexene-1-carboxylate synthase